MKRNQGIACLAVACLLWGGMAPLQRAHAAVRKIQSQSMEQWVEIYPPGARTVLDKAPELVLYSVDPDPFLEGWEEATKLKLPPGARVKKIKKAKELFHDHPVLGKTVVRGAEKRRVLDALYEGITDNQNFAAAGCFEPRHGIRARDPKTGNTVDLLICFSCHNAYIWAKGADREPFHAFGPALQRSLGELFRKRGIKLAP